MKKYSIEILNKAQKEIQISINYYDKISKGLGLKFKVEVSKYIKKLKTNPFYQKLDKDFRFIPLKKFPFIIIYKVQEKQQIVSIYAVFHTSQNPEKQLF